MTTFPTPPLKKVLKAWTYLGKVPGVRVNSDWLSTDDGRVAEDRRTPQSVQSVHDAQVILDAHSDTT
jgi:hypothetical protein